FWRSERAGAIAGGEPAWSGRPSIGVRMFVAFTESCAARRRARRCFVSGALLLFAAEAGAQAAAAPRAPADEALGQGTEPAPPASDLTEIEAALAADAALGTATDERAANRGPSPSPPSMNPDLALIGDRKSVG